MPSALEAVAVAVFVVAAEACPVPELGCGLASSRGAVDASTGTAATLAAAVGAFDLHGSAASAVCVASTSTNVASSDAASDSLAFCCADKGADESGDVFPRFGLVSALAPGVLSGHSGRFQVVSRVSRWMK